MGSQIVSVLGSGLHIDIYNIDMNLRILLFMGGAIMSGLFNVGSNTEEAAFEGELDFTDRAFDETTIWSEGAQDKIAYIDGDSKLKFKTHKGKYVDHNVDCSRTYIPRCCAVYEVTGKFEMSGKGKNCEKGDKVLITYGKRTHEFCGKRIRVNFKSKKSMKINMITDGKVKSKGGQVKIECKRRCLNGCSQTCLNRYFF